jgi:hypothetical protein
MVDRMVAVAVAESQVAVSPSRSPRGCQDLDV